MNVPPKSGQPELNSSDAIYGRNFWLAYAANVLLVCANSLTFRFAEYVAARGGTEELAGAIVQAGLFAAIVFRLGLGAAIDHYGPRRIWLLAGGVYMVGCLSFLIPEKLTLLVWAARVCYQTGLAGMFSCSIVHIQNQVPASRRTEVIGSLGSSGFVGTILGTQVSDLMFTWLPVGQPRFIATFGGAAGLAFLHGLIVVVLTQRDRHVRPEVTPGPIRLLMRYWPGSILVVAVAQGTGFVVTTVFLTRYATAMQFSGITWFFLPYSVMAFSCRWIFRDWGTSFGRHRMVLWGLAGMTVGQLLFLLVSRDWLLVLPALVCGFGHALLFPAIVSIGAGKFPIQYRGSGTTLVLGFTELGTALAAPLLGLLIDLGNAGGGTRGFSWMFLAASGFAFSGLIFYILTAARHPDHDPHVSPAQSLPPDVVEAESDIGDMIAVSADVPAQVPEKLNPAR
ncbi:MAG: MFS transporter [Planctomycetes bacterium]|nr:MFS transporter [Planctomycetota bacterium]